MSAAAAPDTLQSGLRRLRRGARCPRFLRSREGRLSPASPARRLHPGRPGCRGPPAPPRPRRRPELLLLFCASFAGRPGQRPSDAAGGRCEPSPVGCGDARPAPARDLAVLASCPRPPGESFRVGRAHAAQATEPPRPRVGPGWAAAGGVGLRLEGERRPGPESAAPPPPPPRQAPGGSASRTRQLSLQPHSQRGAWRPSACPSCPSLPAHPSRSSLHQQQGNTAILRLRIWSRLNILFIFSD